MTAQQVILAGSWGYLAGSWGGGNPCFIVMFGYNGGKKNQKCLYFNGTNKFQNVTHHLKIMHKEATLKNDMLEPT